MLLYGLELVRGSSRIGLESSPRQLARELGFLTWVMESLIVGEMPRFPLLRRPYDAMALWDDDRE